MKTIPQLSLLTLAMGLAFQPAIAANASDTVTIVAPTPLPGLDLNASQIAAPVQRGLVNDAHSQDLAEWMNRHLGGVIVQELQGNPFQADVQYRGFTASPLLGTPQGLSVYLDGVRMNQPFGDVLSWDLIPRAALKSVTLMPGSNPLFGLNTLGGALALETKDGRSQPGTQLQIQAGSHGRRNLLLEHGFVNDQGLDGYAMANLFHDGGWRAQSPSDVRQFFGKLGWRDGRTRSHLSLSWADNDLHGNGLQEGSQLASDWKSVYTTPDITRQHALMLNWTGSHEVREGWNVSAQIYMRRQKGSTLNGDVNEGSLDQSVYQPSAGERSVLAQNGYSGYPNSGANASNTPFPYWRCLANALLPYDSSSKEPAEKCTGLLTSGQTTQSNQGFVLQSSWESKMGDARTQTVMGAALDTSRVRFTQSSQLGYVNPDRSVTGVNAFGDGVTGGNVDGEPWDTAVDLQGRTRTQSVFASNTWSWAGGWNLTTSGRYNQTRVSNLDLLTRHEGTDASLSGEHRYARLNPAVGLTWAPSAQLQGWLGYNEGSRAPTTTELGCANPEQPCKLPNAMASDPPLQQVVTRTVELGLRGRLADQHAWSVGVFRAVNDQDILFVASQQTGYGYFRNFGQTRRQGLELSLSGALSPEWSYGVHYNWLQATYQSEETVAGNSNSSNSAGPGLEGNIAVKPGDRIPLTPSQMFKLQVTWKPNAQWRWGLDMQSVGRSIARGNENNGHAADGRYYSGAGDNPGYAVFNLSGQYVLQPGWTLTGRINNLLDTRYTTAAVLAPNAFNGNALVARPFAANPDGSYPLRHGTFYAPGAPRSVWVGLRYQFR
ncbi:TonB-dependent receptor [Limnohabitans radicicola]|uniref:TonB-dependent receptor n=1 Tax=Limnohabitans radicicola TaxID=2771427 RepID=A0A927FH35_9BURK|nr:TonB-dependent receptor [Limnohabitans radicicola]MBD8049857.1 TonB-dependent receptor [Limnohabitans radicicola]